MDSQGYSDNHCVSQQPVLLTRYRSLWIPLLALAINVGCGGGNMSQPPGGGTNSADLSLNKSSVDFGGVAVGGNKSNPLILTNASSNGGSNITVSDVGISGTGFSFDAAPLPITLTPGQSTTVTLTFAPKSGGTSNGTLSISIQGVNQPATVALTGMGLAAGQLAVSPTAIDFGTVGVGSVQNQPGSLDAGSTDINVTSASWSGEGFSLSGITFPVTVPAGQSVPFTVSFAPQAVGPSSGNVTFFSDASNSPTTETLSGTGAQTSQHTVSLTWNPSPSNVVGYNVYRATQSGGPYNTKVNGLPLPGTSYIDSSVLAGTTYFYVTTAVDGNSQESVYSNEASAAIP